MHRGVPRIVTYAGNPVISTDKKQTRWPIRRTRISATTSRNKTSQSRTARPRTTARTTSQKTIRSRKKTGNSPPGSPVCSPLSYRKLINCPGLRDRFVLQARYSPAIARIGDNFATTRPTGPRARARANERANEARRHASHKMAEALRSAAERNPFASTSRRTPTFRRHDLVASPWRAVHANTHISR